MHDKNCKYGEMLKGMCDDAMKSAYLKNDMKEFDHVLQHLCAAIALLFAAIKPESRIMALHLIVSKTEEAEQLIIERVEQLKAAMDKLPGDDKISPEILAKAAEALKNMRGSPEH